MVEQSVFRSSLTVRKSLVALSCEHIHFRWLYDYLNAQKRSTSTSQLLFFYIHSVAEGCKWAWGCCWWCHRGRILTPLIIYGRPSLNACLWFSLTDLLPQETGDCPSSLVLVATNMLCSSIFNHLQRNKVCSEFTAASARPVWSFTETSQSVICKLSWIK